MSLWKYLFNSDLLQRIDLDQLENRVREIREHLDSSPAGAEQVPRLQDEVARLALLVEVLTRILFDKGIVTRDEYTTILHRLDAADGVQDGKRTTLLPQHKEQVQSEALEEEAEVSGPLEDLQFCEACQSHSPGSALRCVNCGRPLAPP